MVQFEYPRGPCLMAPNMAKQIMEYRYLGSLCSGLEPTMSFVKWKRQDCAICNVVSLLYADIFHLGRRIANRTLYCLLSKFSSSIFPSSQVFFSRLSASFSPAVVASAGNNISCHKHLVLGIATRGILFVKHYIRMSVLSLDLGD